MAIYDLPFFSFPALPESKERSDVKVSTAKPDAGARPVRGPELVHDRVYDLRRGGKTSDMFYNELTALADRVLAEVELYAAAALRGYNQFVTSQLRETPRSQGEYAIELLTLGMALRLYREAAAETPGWVVDLARELYWMRRRSPGVKPILDFFRAGLLQLFMAKKLDAAVTGEGPGETAGGAGRDHGMADLPRLIEWLHATGEFKAEAMRLDHWNCYLRTLPAEQADSWIRTSVSLFDWFHREAELAVGPYTAGVNRFLRSESAHRYWREDRLFCSRRAVEYHLGMIAAEIMNHAMREEFTRKPKKALLVPACMRGEHAGTCHAHSDGVDITCAGCDPDCTINRITERMRDDGVNVYMVPHSSGFSRWLERWEADKDEVGVTAVACLLNILPGGYEMRARGIASQCVPLDYPGCKKHWSREDVPTGVNEERLVEIVTGPKD